MMSSPEYNNLPYVLGLLYIYVYIINMIYYFVHKNIFVVDNITSSVQIVYQTKVKLFTSF